jgi:hypothetical protein
MKDYNIDVQKNRAAQRSSGTLNLQGFGNLEGFVVTLFI